MKNHRSLFLALLVLSLLAACGNKGDLVRPVATPETPEAPATN